MSGLANLTPALRKLRQQLAQGPVSFTQLWQDQAPLWHALGWREAQARLYLRSLAGMVVTAEKGGTDDANTLCFQLQGEAALAVATAANLADEMVALLTHSGRPLPLAQLLNKMPAGQVLTELMLRAAAAADSRLSLIGPLVRLI